MKSPCYCLEHRDSPPPTTYGEHTFSLEESIDERDARWRPIRWRATCTCSFRSRWQYQSDSVAYHAWMNHIARALGAEALSNTSRGRNRNG